LLVGLERKVSQVSQVRVFSDKVGEIFF
jgi:hypothetical protein